uniref:Uncharacterized protein n=1 Tax=Lactuca sativa TaxID=4236 RepID=A0A9R1W6J1_LACSA|nr:hypothetical protein LSAT_V11C300125750 [Lactuca sativa]
MGWWSLCQVVRELEFTFRVDICEIGVLVGVLANIPYERFGKTVGPRGIPVMPKARDTFRQTVGPTGRSSQTDGPALPFVIADPERCKLWLGSNQFMVNIVRLPLHVADKKVSRLVTVVGRDEEYSDSNLPVRVISFQFDDIFISFESDMRNSLSRLFSLNNSLAIIRFIPLIVKFRIRVSVFYFVFSSDLIRYIIWCIMSNSSVIDGDLYSSMSESEVEEDVENSFF